MPKRPRPVPDQAPVPRKSLRISRAVGRGESNLVEATPFSGIHSGASSVSPIHVAKTELHPKNEATTADTASLESQQGFKASEILAGGFDQLLKDYPNTVPKELRPLDKRRLEELPAILKSRGDQFPNPYLEKDELVELVEWKLKHGKFRPTLLALVKSNDSERVKEVTSDAFSILVTKKRGPQEVREAMKRLCDLKGIGPATASLMLSTFDEDNLPFFSDELFLWLHWDEPVNAGTAPKGNGTGWKRNIRYTAKEYESLIDKLVQVKERLKTSHNRDSTALEWEKVAWALGKQQMLG
ncbi:hypothetical protein P152DRAFT_432696 [Eremomyces bilateralis CBS 781.70]|uniref:Uncharacterized protein n=1 Tax=Eremomyces bilateralis CBS 781.70 TaxID=1392243 RepID=A0A6G1G9H1_9PEZI|nr:uncharacterized protein P152DRAFT_432696 [Eremomyces bilateralis CBS 781.70]KAF1814586.1 hypothetical protein P152DRAFT_432696 [Eremomyces bilateralis CBS 781.70]